MASAPNLAGLSFSSPARVRTHALEALRGYVDDELLEIASGDAPVDTADRVASVLHTAATVFVAEALVKMRLDLGLAVCARIESEHTDRETARRLAAAFRTACGD